VRNHTFALTPAVLEIYNDWCGPCKAINATCKRIYFEHGDRGLKFYTAAAAKLDVAAPYRGKCAPAFLMFRNGQELKSLRVEGVNSPKLVGNIVAKLDEA